MHTVKRLDIRGNTFEEGWGTIPRTFPPKKSDFGGIWGVAAPAGDPGRVVVCVERGKEREGGGRRPARAQDIGPVAPARMATLARHMHWRDRGYLSRHAGWRDQTGYALQIKTNTG